MGSCSITALDLNELCTFKGNSTSCLCIHCRFLVIYWLNAWVRRNSFLSMPCLCIVSRNLNLRCSFVVLNKYHFSNIKQIHNFLCNQVSYGHKSNSLRIMIDPAGALMLF